MNDSKQFCHWNDLHCKALTAHTYIYTHRCMWIHKYSHTQTQTQDPSVQFSGVDFVTVVQNWMIEITVIGGHVTAAAAAGMCLSVCVSHTCVNLCVCFCVCQNLFDLRRFWTKTLKMIQFPPPLQGC